MDLKDIKGIGPAKLQKLQNLGIFNVKDLFYHFPYRYIDRRRELKIIDLFLIEDENFHAIGTLEKISVIRIRGGRQLTNAYISDDTGKIAVTWFNNPYISSNYKVGDKVVFSGKPEKKKLINPKLRKVNSDEDIKNFAAIEATYSETKGLKSNQISNFVKNSLNYLTEIKDKLPKKILKQENLINLTDAIIKIHFPQGSDDIEVSRKRLAFDEIYRILKLVKKRKDEINKFASPVIDLNEKLNESLINSLPFELTSSQNRALAEIFADLRLGKPMHRLLNGDVGSGKTLVAALASVQVLENNHQVIILAPTGVLAKQHFDFFQEFLKNQDYKIHLVTSSTKKEIDKLEKEISDSNQKEIFIGTHAILYRFELFKKVGLIVIDEQHKFGVKQRELLESFQFSVSNEHTLGSAPQTYSDQKTDHWSLSTDNFLPHVLSMSATPIPRSLALTLYGDLDVSILEKPIERKPIITRCIYDEATLLKMYDWIESQIQTKKAQIYVICPLIEESEKIDIKSAIQEFENLKKKYPKFRIELLHGKIKAKDKDDTLDRFLKKQIDILVSTSVIEVGINNPNASIMIIEGAERFGLAQLHQIRGRVGRSDIQSYCFLKSSNFQPNERLDFFSGSNDGFAIAEYDLLSRGPGEVYGNIQSGLPKLRIASLFDIEFIKKVKKYV